MATPTQQDTMPLVVTETREGRFHSHVTTGAHQFVADEPVDAGGLDAGPSPYDLLAAALGTCTTMTLRMYADRKRLPLLRARVEVSHGKIHARDCEDCVEGRAGLIDHFHRELHLDGDLDDGQRTSLLAIANRCPVHRTLESSSHITTNLSA